MKNKIMICVGTSGLSAGAEAVVENFRLELVNRKLADRFQIVQTGDRGLFRDVLVDIVTPELGRITYEYVKPEHVALIADSHLEKGKPVEKLQAGEDYKRFFAGQMRVVLANCGEIDPENMDDYIAAGGYAGLPKALQMPPQRVIEEIQQSGLRGRGGAGFPTGTKWNFARSARNSVKYIVCNADEGDPGAFMDRSILEGDPHSVIEGMIIAGYAIGAQEGYVYCRAEYPLALKRIRKAIDDAQNRGYLGQRLLHTDFSFEVHVKEGAGAFVCGEETALIASIEGRRGMPVPRPPFPAQEGVWGKPTIINNVETLANVARIIVNGASWFSGIGTDKSKGTKVFALAGQVKNTGLVEVPMGTTLRQLVEGPGGGMASRNIPFKGVQIGGPSGGCLPESLLDTSIDYESIGKTGAIMGSGGMVVMDARTCMVDMARFFLDFTVAESCGKCVACRIGLQRMLEVLTEITEGKGTDQHVAFLREMSGTIKDTALCGLGNTAPNPVLTTLKYFPDEYQAHIRERRCQSHVCLQLLKFEVMDDSCKKCGICSKVCPAKAVEWKKKEYAKIDHDKCIRCKACISACPFMAIQ